MEFDKQYYDARKAAIKWLNRDKRDYNQGVDILAAMRFKPLLCKRLSMHQGNAVLMRILDVALRDACKACRTNKEYVDEIPPELEVLDAGTHQAVQEEKQMTEEEKVADSPIENYPPTVQKVYRLFAKAYKDRDNAIISIDPHGNRHLVYEPVPAEETEWHMDQLCLAYSELSTQG